MRVSVASGVPTRIPPFSGHLPEPQIGPGESQGSRGSPVSVLLPRRDQQTL